jgi:hypothetical protein
MTSLVPGVCNSINIHCSQEMGALQTWEKFAPNVRLTRPKNVI